MDKLTTADWNVINSALAYYEAEVDGGIDNGTFTEAELRHIERARRKVHQRLAGGRATDRTSR